MDFKELVDAIKSLGDVRPEATGSQGLQDILSSLTQQTNDNGVVVRGSLAAVDTGGGVFAWQNTTGRPVLVNVLALKVDLPATAACTVSVGSTAVSAVTSSANLIDTLDVHSAAGVFSNLLNGGVNGKAAQAVANNAWVTASVATGASAGLAGTYFLHYLVV